MYAVIHGPRTIIKIKPYVTVYCENMGPFWGTVMESRIFTVHGHIRLYFNDGTVRLTASTQRFVLIDLGYVRFITLTQMMFFSFKSKDHPCPCPCPWE